MNTNIDNYNIQELEKLLKLDLNYSKDDVINKVENLNETYFSKDIELQNFFLNVKNKLLGYFDENKEDENDDNIFNFGSNIETMQNINNNSSSEESEEEEEKKAIRMLEDKGETQSYNIYDLIKKNKAIIKNYKTYNYLHFNTLFRAKNNPILTTLTPKTNSNFNLSSPINFISQVKLASINIKKPYLISETKLNNKFIIKKFIKKDDVISCDFSNVITIENGYYEDPIELENYLNMNYFDQSSNYSAGDFMKNINFSINKNTRRISFELSNNYLDSVNVNGGDASFNYFSVDFKTNYTQYYSLANVLGFDSFKSSTYYTSIDDISNMRLNNNKILSPFTFSNIGNNELFFCFDEYQSNIIETHKLFLNNNMSTHKILAKINSNLGNKSNNYYINQIFSENNDRFDDVREYDGLINFYNFSIKIIDYYGNIINEDMDEDFTFTLEVKIENSKLIQD